VNESTHARMLAVKYCSRLFWFWLLQEYVNYRQSCLTRLLKECLGGNSHSCMFANIAQGNYLVCTAAAYGRAAVPFPIRLVHPGGIGDSCVGLYSLPVGHGVDPELRQEGHEDCLQAICHRSRGTEAETRYRALVIGHVGRKRQQFVPRRKWVTSSLPQDVSTKNF
jgi:hypothetical protein